MPDLAKVPNTKAKSIIWGNALPKLQAYKSGVLIGEWQFTSLDNFRMELACLRLVDSQEEMVNGLIRQRIRGFRLTAGFTLRNVENRSIMLFLRRVFLADQIIFTPHPGGMINPLNQSFEFSMLVDGDFDPKYFDGRMIGHEFEFKLIGTELLPEIPDDWGGFNITPATTMRSAGATVPDPITSISRWGEKRWWSGWELTEDDLRSCAFWVYVPPEDRDPYGDFT